jgi:hypothetical protein
VLKLIKFDKAETKKTNIDKIEKHAKLRSTVKLTLEKALKITYKEDKKKSITVLLNGKKTH